MKTICSNARVESNAGRYVWFVITFIVLVAIAERAWLLFSTPLVPGMNGAYYLVQTRSLLEHARLGIPDFPLTFCVDAVLAKLIQLIFRVSFESSIVLAVKLEDALLPALVALPVFALVHGWARRAGAGIWLPVCAALTVAAGAPALAMAGDFQKNSLALLWLAALLWRLRIWLDEPKAKNAALAVMFLILTGLTHIGVFGWALVLAALALTVGIWRGKPETRHVIWPWLFAGGAACLLAAALVLWKFDPARVHRLANALTHPLTYLGNDQGKRGSPPNFKPPNLFLSGQNGFRPQPNGNRNFPPPGGGPGGMLLGPRNWVPSAAFLLVSAGALTAVWFRRKRLSGGDVAVVVGCGLGLIVLGGPWVTGDKVMRFSLIAVGPAVICAAFALLELPFPKTRNTVMAFIAIVLVGAGVALNKHGGQPVITAQAADELRSLAGEISEPARTLIVARHGLEWWTAWFLHTHVAHVDALADSDWQNYVQIFFLRQKSGMQMRFGPRPGDRQFPPVFGSRDWDDDHPPPRDFPAAFAPPGGGGALGEPVIPRNAEIAHDGVCFTLARVVTPSGFNPVQSETFESPPLPPDELP